MNGEIIMEIYEIGQFIKTMRKAKKMTQKDLAIKLNKAESTIGLWEQGRRELDYDSLNEVANLFNVSVDYLLGRSFVRDNTASNELDDFTFALYGEIKDLTDTEKEDILDMVKKMKEIIRKK